MFFAFYIMWQRNMLVKAMAVSVFQLWQECWLTGPHFLPGRYSVLGEMDWLQVGTLPWCLVPGPKVLHSDLLRAVLFLAWCSVAADATGCKRRAWQYRTQSPLHSWLTPCTTQRLLLWLPEWAGRCSRNYPGACSLGQCCEWVIHFLSSKISEAVALLKHGIPGALGTHQQLLCFAASR